MSHQIDRSSPLPLYYQLKQILLEKIESGLWSPGDLIPSEHELQETYGVSRTTVRQTLSDLVHEGVLVRHRGRGTLSRNPSSSTIRHRCRLFLSISFSKVSIRSGNCATGNG